MRIPLSNESHKSVYVYCIHKKCNSKKENKTENLSKDALQKTKNFNKLQFTQNDQTDVGDQTDQTDQTEQSDQTEQGDQSDQTDLSDQTDQGDQTDQTDQTD